MGLQDQLLSVAQDTFLCDNGTVRSDSDIGNLLVLYSEGLEACFGRLSEFCKMLLANRDFPSFNSSDLDNHLTRVFEDYEMLVLEFLRKEK